MKNRLLDTIEIALNDLSSTSDKLILAPEGEILKKKNVHIVELRNNFGVEDVLALIGYNQYIGIVNSERFNSSNLTELINILTSEKNATIVVLSDNPISCKIFYPAPDIGTKYVEGNYEYSYGQYLNHSLWKSVNAQNGWGVRVIDKHQTNYDSPLTIIQGKPVNNMAYLFQGDSSTNLNLSNWDTSRVTDMSYMFSYTLADSLDLSSFNTSNVTNMFGMFSSSLATSLDLRSFDTSNVTTMQDMFARSKATCINLSNFDTSKVTNMRNMFFHSDVSSLDLRNFNTSNVTDMNNMFAYSKMKILDVRSFNTASVTDMECMFYCIKATSLNLSNFDTSNVTNMKSMFLSSPLVNLDLSSFDISNVTNIAHMFSSSCLKTLLAKTQEDAIRYKNIYTFESGIQIIVKNG